MFAGDRRRTVVICVALQALVGVVLLASHSWLTAVPPSTQPVARARQRVMDTTLNCTVSLAQADAALLKKQVWTMVRSLADTHPWIGDIMDTSEEGQNLTKGENWVTEGRATPRAVDAAFGVKSADSVPGVEDVHGELKAMMDVSLASMTPLEAAALRRQSHTGVLELGMWAADHLNDTHTIPARLAFLNVLAAEVEARETLRVAIVTTTGADLWGVRQELLPWLQYHTDLGVTKFYILYNGHDQTAVDALRKIRHVSIIHVHPPWATAEDETYRDMYFAASQQKKKRPGNYELMVTQGFGEYEGLRRAKADGMHWLMHLDADELFYPGDATLSVTGVLGAAPADVASLRFMNFEGQAEAGDMSNRYEQVTLFRVHKHFITPEAHWYRSRFKLGSSSSFLLLYANGKAAVRVDAPGVRHLGPHFWSGDPSPRWQSAANPEGEFTNRVSDAGVVLHYTYSYMSDVTAKAHRSCPDEYLEAARAGDRAKVSECFVIGADQDAFMAAAAGPAAVRDFYFSRFVLSEGASVRCTDPDTKLKGWCELVNVARLKYLLEKIGLYRRIALPATLLRQHERAIQAIHASTAEA